MAQRRMVSVKIIDSAKFIKMPVSCQSLYFHLIARADDDGIVEAFNVMRMVGASEDDLKILVAKQFATVLNEDLVTFINDWNEHNLIRADRKIDSIYQELLLQVVSIDEIKQKRERADRRKVLFIENSFQNDVTGTSHGQSTDSIGKDRLGKDSIDNKIIDADFVEVEEKQKKIKKEKTNINEIEVEEIWAAYPRKVGKVSALKTIPELLKKYTKEQLIQSAKDYNKSVKDKNFLAHGSTFFNGLYLDFVKTETTKAKEQDTPIEFETRYVE